MNKKKLVQLAPQQDPIEQENGEQAGAQAGAQAGEQAEPVFLKNISPSCREKLAKIIKEAHEDGRIIKCTLHKPGIPGVKGQNKRLLGQWLDYIPEEHDVGLTHGSGFYFMKIFIPQKDAPDELIFHSFTLDAVYDEYKRENDKTKNRPLAIQINPTGATSEPLPLVIQQALPPAAPTLLSGAGQLTDLMTLIEKIASILKPQESELEKLGKFGEVLAVSMQKSLMSNIAFFRQLQATVLPMLTDKDDDDPDDPDEDLKIVKGDGQGMIPTTAQENILITTAKAALPKILPQLASYVLRLLDPDPAKSEQIIKMLKQYGIINMFSIPALSDDMKKTVAFLDTQITPEKTTAALSKLGVDANVYR